MKGWIRFNHSSWNAGVLINCVQVYAQNFARNEKKSAIIDILSNDVAEQRC